MSVDTDDAATPRTTTPRRTPDEVRVDTERFLATVGRLRAELRTTRRRLDRIGAALLGAEAECGRLRAENAALRVARDSALRLAAWGGGPPPREGAR